MKTKLYSKLTLQFALFVLCLLANSVLSAQNATRSLPFGIGRNCGAGTATTATSDSVKVYNFNDVTNSFTSLYAGKPVLNTPGFSPYSGSIAFNPQDQKMYYIVTTTGSNSSIFVWTPNTTPSGLSRTYNYSTQFIVGLDFDPTTGTGYQLEFNGSTPPYVISIRKVNFATNYFGPSDTLILPPGKNIYKQSGDVVFTPLGQLYFAFDNKLFQVDYSNYGPGAKLNTTFIDTLALGNVLLGMTYAQGKFIASCQNSGNTTCSFKEIDISSGTAVINNITLPAGVTQYTGTDLASMITGIGVAKKVTSVTSLSATSYLVTYDVKLKSYGNNNLTNVQLTDSIAKVFGAAFVSASVSAFGTLPAGLTINPSYNGKTNCNVFVGGATSTLNATPADSAIVRLTVTLNNPNVNTIYYSTAVASAQSAFFSTTVSDSSNNNAFLTPDINFNSVPDEANEDIPTPLQLNNWTTLATRLVDFNASLSGTNAGIRFMLENGGEPLTIEIQRSLGANLFESIYSTSVAAGQRTVQSNWVDKDFDKTKTNFYRLKITKADGSFFYSDVAKVAYVPALGSVEIGPNPFTKSLTIQLQLNQNDQVQYTLVGINGKVISEGKKAGQKGDNRIVIDNLPDIPPGMYLLQLNVGNEHHIRKVVKQ